MSRFSLKWLWSNACNHPAVVFRDGGAYCTECQQRIH